MSTILFFIGIIVSASGIVPTPLALALGLLYGFTVTHPLQAQSRQLAHFLLQASVVCLGFGMQLGPVVKAGRSGFLYTAISIASALTLGWLLGHLLRVKAKQSFLISVGTAICGGSAIAAIGPVLEANAEEMAISLATVFTLNAVALLAFPPIGHALALSQTQFGLWCALAIHDTSSVVGAAAAYGPFALLTGTTVKLARALWIVPVTFAAAFVMARRGVVRNCTSATAATPAASKRIAAFESSEEMPSQHARSAMSNVLPAGSAVTSQPAPAESPTKIALPWFILLFLFAAVLTTWVPIFTPAYTALNHLGRSGLTVVLFLIGTGLSVDTIRRIGPRPMIQGVVLWIVVASAALFAVYKSIISL